MQYSRIGDVIEGKKLDCKIGEVNSTFSPVQQPVPNPKCNADMLIIDDADIQRKYRFLYPHQFVALRVPQLHLDLILRIRGG